VSRLRLWAGILLVLALAATWAAIASQPRENRRPALPEPAATTPSSPAATLPEVSAVREALEAWAAFAGSGDASVLAGHFHPGGPQAALLLQEARSLRVLGGSGPYRFQMSGARVLDTERGRTVLTGVRFTGPGGSNTWRWEIVLRQSGGRWLVWTVVDVGEAMGFGAPSRR